MRLHFFLPDVIYVVTRQSTARFLSPVSTSRNQASPLVDLFTESPETSQPEGSLDTASFEERICEDGDDSITRVHPDLDTSTPGSSS
jgi:hypothetical protein